MLPNEPFLIDGFSVWLMYASLTSRMSTYHIQIALSSNSSSACLKLAVAALGRLARSYLQTHPVLVFCKTASRVNSPTADHVSAERPMVKILMGCTNATLVFQTFALMSRFCNCGGIPNCESASTLLCACARSHRCAVGAFQPRARGISTSLLIPQYVIWPHLKSKVLWGSPCPEYPRPPRPCTLMCTHVACMFYACITPHMPWQYFRAVDSWL